MKMRHFQTLTLVIALSPFTQAADYSYPDHTDDRDILYFGYTATGNGGGPGLKIVRKTDDTVHVTVASLETGTLTINGGGGDDHIEAVSRDTKEGEAFDAIANLTFSAIELNGGEGNDTISGTPFADIILGGNGHDELTGNNGNDDIFGQDGNDFLKGDDGVDLLRGGDGDDLLFGGDGNDKVGGEPGRDGGLFGELGNDVLHGNSHDDDLHGGGNDDILVGGTGWDLVDGGSGTDELICRTDLSADPAYDPGDVATAASDTLEDCADMVGQCRRIEIVTRKDPYTDWAAMWNWRTGTTFMLHTTSSRAVLMADRAAGANLLLDAAGDPLHTTHKQYPSTCGPSSLTMVMEQLGKTDPSRRLNLPRNLDVDPVPQRLGIDETCRVGYPLTAEHILLEGHNRARTLDPSWGPAGYLLGSLLQLTPSGRRRTHYQIPYDLHYDAANRVDFWLERSPACGTGGETDADRTTKGLPFVANKFGGGRLDAYPVGINFGETFDDLGHLKDVVRGFIGHGIPLVVGVERGGHFNTLMGYWEDGPDFYIYMADPLDGWGRGWSNKPMRWKKLLLTESTVNAGAFVSVMLYAHSDAAWAAEIDAGYDIDALLGYLDAIPNFRPFWWGVEDDIAVAGSKAVDDPVDIQVPEGTTLTFPSDPVYGPLHVALDPEGADTYYRWYFNGSTSADVVGYAMTRNFKDDGMMDIIVQGVDDPSLAGLRTRSDYALRVWTQNVPPSPDLRQLGRRQIQWDTPAYVYRICASFSDPGRLDDSPYTVTTVWGDGDVSVGDELDPATTDRLYTCREDPMDYTIRLTVVDNDGGVGVTSMTVHVPSESEYWDEKADILNFQLLRQRWEAIDASREMAIMRRQRAAVPDLLDPSPLLYFRARIEDTGSARMLPALLAEGEASTPAQIWTHQAVARNAKGDVLATVRALPQSPDGNQTFGGGPSGFATATVALEYMPDIHSLELQDAKGHTLVSVTASANRPDIAFNEPPARGGEFLRTPHTVSWNGKDVDPGTKLTYAVAVSPDRRTWTWVAIDLTETSYTFTDDSLPPGPSYVKVLVSDGLLTDQVISREPLVVFPEPEDPNPPQPDQTAPVVVNFTLAEDTGRPGDLCTADSTPLLFVEFSEPILGKEDYVKLNGPDGDAVPLVAVGGWGSRWLLIQLDGPMPKTGRYALTLSAKITDRAGLQLNDGNDETRRFSLLGGGLNPIINPCACGHGSPRLAGKIEGGEGEVKVTVEGNVYEALTGGDGNWWLPEGTIQPNLGPGHYDVAVETVDGAGTHTGLIFQNAVTVDPDPPEVHDFSVEDPSGRVQGVTHSRVVSVTFTDDGTGSSVVGWLLTESPSPSQRDARSWLGSRPTSYRLSPDPGEKHLYAWVKDAAGNISPVAADSHGEIVYDPGEKLTFSLTDSAIPRVVLGTWQAATDDFDNGLDEIAPLPESDILAHMHIRYTGSAVRAPEGLTVDYRDPKTDLHRWRLAIDVPPQRGSHYLSWDPSLIPGDARLIILQPLDGETTSGQPINLRNSQTIEVKEDCEFEIAYGNPVLSRIPLNQGWNLLGTRIMTLEQPILTFGIVRNTVQRTDVTAFLWHNGLLRKLHEDQLPLAETGHWILINDEHMVLETIGIPADGLVSLQAGWNLVPLPGGFRAPQDRAFSLSFWTFRSGEGYYIPLAPGDEIPEPESCWIYTPTPTELDTNSTTPAWQRLLKRADRQCLTSRPPPVGASCK